MNQSTASSHDTGCVFVGAGRGPLRWSTVNTPVGELTLIGEPDGVLRRIRFGGSAPGTEDMQHDAGALSEAAEQIDAYFGGRLRRFELQLAPDGTPFQRCVWAALAEIPFGQTRTYAEIAAQVGSPKGFRAVGGANRVNPLPLIVPCHRVIASGSTFGGYLWGLELKGKLLRHEGHEVSGDRIAPAATLF